ncbi:MAG: protein kinase, partial [Chitinivibrionales bacterium]|nr:protein kinase [Chitinivibrionales bacterium]
MADNGASGPDRDYDSVLERTVPSEQFDADGIRRELERTSVDADPAVAPQSFLLRTETDTAMTPTEDTTTLGGFGDTTAVPPKLLADDKQGGPRFSIVDEIGTGGTAKVFAVHDRSLNRTIALKLLRGKRASKPGVENRFIHEARVTAMLEHPNIMPVHDIGTTDEGRVYFTMKNIAGISLGDAIRAEKAGEPVPDDFRTLYGKLSIILRVADALSFAHDKGYLHQDVKPDNIMLGEYGEVLLLDWGCALTTSEAVRTDDRPAYGTPAYMSPEQARREAVDERCDVYCIGATLFHALFLRHPTWSNDPEEFWDKKRRGEIDAPTDSERGRVPAALVDIVLKALATDPAQRYQTVALFARDLERYLAGRAVSAHRETPIEVFVRWYRRNRRLFWVSSIAAAVVAGTGALLLREKIQEWVTWRLVYREDFENTATADLRNHWQARQSRNWYEFETVDITESDAWRVEQGALHAYGRTALAALTFTRPIAGDLRVEWDVTALNKGENLNCFIAGDVRSAGYAFHIGARASNTTCDLTKGKQLQRLEKVELSEPLRTGKTYHFRMEREGKRVGLTIDGERVFEYHDPDVLDGIGHRVFGFEVAIDNHLIIDNIEVYHHPLPLKVSPLAIPRRFLAEGQRGVALAQFRELAATYPGTPVAAEASYYEGMCLLQLDSLRAADEVFDRFVAANPRHALAPLALLERAEILRSQGDTESADSLCDRLMREHGGTHVGRAILLDMDNARLRRLEEGIRSFGADSAADARLLAWIERESGSMIRWVALAKDTTSAFLDEAAGFLVGPHVGGEHRAIADRFRGYTEEIAHSLTQAGAAELMESMLPEHRDYCASALERTGAYEDVLRDYPDQPEACASALVALGRYDEVIERHPGEREQAAISLLALGRYDELFARYPDV